ncbi:MAG: carbohydrate ABC transporter permease [Defluviitaleaceae bacterium]|nr:carbohydrate ABC transporter permease [Defluviitaleaceae bacterium]
MDESRETSGTGFAVRDSLGDRIFTICCYVIVVFIVIITLYPFWDTFILSISPRQEALQPGLRLFTLNPTLEAYQSVLRSAEILRSFWNAVIRVFLGTFVSIVVVTLAGYPLSKSNMPFVRPISLFFLFTMYFSGGLIPTYLLIVNLGLINSVWSLVLPGAASAFNLIIMRSFIETLPSSLEESATIDGANFLQVWFKIIVPLSKPVIATVILWQAVAHWNAWFDAMIYMHERARFTLPVVLRRILIESQIEQLMPGTDLSLDVMRPPPTPETIKGTVIMVSTVPIIMVYPFLQKYFTKGVLLGAVKG